MRRWLLAALGGVLAVFLALLAQPAPARAGDGDCANTGATPYQPSYTDLQDAFFRAANDLLGSGFFTLPQIKRGHPVPTLVAARAPALLLKAIAASESSWFQATYATSRGSNGPPLMPSGGCAYGVTQIASGMAYPGQMDSSTQYRIANEYRYNAGWGAKVLVEKWNVAPSFGRKVVGQRDPGIIEDWYYAVWGYNGWSYQNNPNNPDYTWPRPAFNSPGGLPRSEYPYQEIVWGFAAYPLRSGGGAGPELWGGVPLTLPDRDLVGDPPQDIPTPAPSHAAFPYQAYFPMAAKGYAGGW